METSPNGFYGVVRLVIRIGIGRRVDESRNEVVLLILTFGLVQLFDDAILIPTHWQLRNRNPALYRRVFSQTVDSVIFGSAIWSHATCAPSHYTCKIIYQIVRALQVMSDITSQQSSYLELTSQAQESAKKEEVERVANAFSEFLEVEYHDAIFSDANYIPYEQVEEMARLEKSVDELKQRSAELAFEVKSMTDQKERIEARIATLGKVQETTKKLEDEALAGKSTLLKIEREVRQMTEEEQTIVTVDTAKFKAQLQKKRKSDETVIENMRKVIRKQETEIAEWKEKLAQLREKMQNEQRLQMESMDMRSSQSVKRLEHDSKVALQASIAKLKQYIQNNEHYLQ